MEIKGIGLDEVEPDADNPRDEFGDIGALAATFELGPFPGEPVNPIVVVADGCRYRIVDGERRYRAMRSAGTGSCHALVCDDLDEADAAVAMVATDDKLRLTELEKSRGTQQMLLLGVDPETVDRVAHVEGSERAARALRGLGPRFERARELTFDQLIVLDEFDGDEEAVGRLLDAEPGDFAQEANVLRYERANEADLGEILAGLSRLRVPVRESAESGVPSIGVVRAGDVDGAVAAACVEHMGVYAVVDEGGVTPWCRDRPCARLYGERIDGADEADVERREAEAREERIREVFEAFPGQSAGPSRWLAGQMADGEAPRAVREWLLESFEDQHSSQLGEFEEATGYAYGQRARDAADQMGELDVIVAWQHALPSGGRYLATKVESGEYDKLHADTVRRIVDFMRDVEGLGYDLSAPEAEMVGKCEEYLAAGEGKGDGDEGD